MFPALGSTVHYREGDHIFAGMIVHVTSKDKVNLVIWNQFGEQSTVVDALEAKEFDHASTVPVPDRTWFWPFSIGGRGKI